MSDKFLWARFVPPRRDVSPKPPNVSALSIFDKCDNASDASELLGSARLPRADEHTDGCINRYKTARYDAIRIRTNFIQLRDYNRTCSIVRIY